MLTMTLSLLLLKVNIFKRSISCESFSFRLSTHLFYPDTEIWESDRSLYVGGGSSGTRCLQLLS